MSRVYEYKNKDIGVKNSVLSLCQIRELKKEINRINRGKNDKQI